ncbi:hypothetical protein ABKN59_004974 [Abortiporus biennis]
MLPEDIGYGGAVILANVEEINEMKAFLPVLQHHKRYLEYALSPGWPIHKMRVESKEGHRFFPVGRRRAGNRSLIDRGKREYVAFDCQKKNLVLLKDAWRADSVSIHSELEIYAVLHKSGVKYIPTVVSGGDVYPRQGTITHSFLGLVGFVRYRIVMKQICRPLHDHWDPRESTAAVYYAAYAHELAWNAGILHRNINDSSIVIDDDPEDIPPGQPKMIKGLLIEWDSAKLKHELKKSSRTGTWQFMSALAQRYPKKHYEVADDIESFIHVLILIGLRFQRHSMTDTPKVLKLYMESVYDGY